jgi:uncharacterized repeat protein (TIGR01451 family)
MRTTALVVAFLGLARVAGAQPFDVSWWTVDGGGASGLAGGSFLVSGTCGQPDAGGPFASATYALTGGFWSPFAGGSAIIQANLACTKTDGQASAVPGLPLTYTIVVSNAGPDATSGAGVIDTLPAALGGATWSCAPSPGASCTPTGSGSISDSVALPASGSVTYTLTALVDPAATGVVANSATVTAPAGVTDPVIANNSATDVDTLTPRADLALSLSDSADPVRSRDPLDYTVQVTNLGPSVSPSMTLTDTLPTELGFVSATPACTFAGGTLSCALGPLAPLASTTVTLATRVTPDPVAGLVNSARVTGAVTDPAAANDVASEPTDVLFRATGEVAHGTTARGDLAGLATLADADYYRLEQQPYASYEIVVDEAAGDVGAGAGPALERIVADGQSILQTAAPVGTGSSRSLRFVNASSAAVTDEMVRVRSQECTSGCGPDDTYRLRSYETTYSVPRFNNSSSQVTVLMLQNASPAPIGGRLYFWSPAGALLHEQPFAVPVHGLYTLITSTVSALSGQSGSATIVHDAPYGLLAGKAVALEPATGFSFDTPLAGRTR